MSTQVYLEVGSKKVFACTLAWPGWCRSGKTEESALETLAAYAPRYAPVPERAGIRFPRSSADRFEVVERVPGSATTDFGALGEPTSGDNEPLTKREATRLAALVEASWEVFDQVVDGAPADLRKGPRGGGRDRDKIVEHVVSAEVAYVRKVGLRFGSVDPKDRSAVAELRRATLEALRSARSPWPDLAKGWLYRYAARRIAWHVLDHAWEIEDRRE